MRIKSERIGIGYYDLVRHKVNKIIYKECSPINLCLHRMVHIHKEFLLDTYISFGFKKHHNIINIIVTIQSEILEKDYGGEITLLNTKQNQQFQQPFMIQPSINNNNNNNIDNNNNYGPIRGGLHDDFSNNLRNNPLIINSVNSNQNKRNLPSLS